MDAWIWIVLAVPALVLILRTVGRRSYGGVDPTQLLLEPDLVNEVRRLATANQKVAAIKLLREGTPGLGLATAKLMVDRMAASAPPTPEFRSADIEPSSMVDLSKSDPVTAADTVPSASPVPLDVELAARSLKSAGQPIRAVQLVRPHTANLLEAKIFVDRL